MINPTSIPVAISQLKLRFAFRGYNPSILQCVDETNESEIMVIDDEQTHISHFTQDENQRMRCMTVKNANQKKFYLLAIDNRLISNRPGGIADCALFDELQFNFVEFKTNALGNSIPQIEYTYKDALGQLDATYTLFRNKINAAGVDFDHKTEVHCFITVANHFPRQSAIEQNIVKEAADGVNHLDLSFEPEIQIS